jgi:NAD(P)-dependent dehydrogenase (short-subunit alcohol dehydrogenase family)
LNEKVAVITGCSSGFGLLTAVELARRGWLVAATMRDVAKRGRLDEAAAHAAVTARIAVHPLDVANIPAVPEAVSAILRQHGRIDALINNAGFAMAGFFEDLSIDELRRQFDTNFFGHVAVTKAVLPMMRQQRSGHIVLMSSISGLIGYPAVGAYSASKHALEGFGETLRLEMNPVGIRVVLVEPGAFDTDVWEKNVKLAEGARRQDSPNRERGLKMRERIRESKKADPTVVSRLVADICETPNPRLRYVVGRDANMGRLLKRVLPWSVFEKLVGGRVKN